MRLTPQSRSQRLSWELRRFCSKCYQFRFGQTQGPCTAVWGHPHENPGRRPKNRAAVVAVLLSRDCLGGTTHREVSAPTRIPSSKRDKIIIKFSPQMLPWFVQ